MCWQKHLPGASKKEDVWLNPVPVSACGTSFHDIIQNMMVAAQVPRSFTAMCLQADWHNVCEECGADWSIGHFAVILLTDVVYGVFFFFSFFLELMLFPGILETWDYISWSYRLSREFIFPWQGQWGQRGPPGRSGAPGRDGEDGKDGEPGLPGSPGLQVSVLLNDGGSSLFPLNLKF